MSTSNSGSSGVTSLLVADNSQINVPLQRLMERVIAVHSHKASLERARSEGHVASHLNYDRKRIVRDNLESAPKEIEELERLLEQERQSEQDWKIFVTGMQSSVNVFYSKIAGSVRDYWGLSKRTDHHHFDALSRLHLLLSAAQYEPMTQEAFDLCIASSFEVTVPLVPLWSKLDTSPFQRWVNEKQLYEDEAPFFSRHMLIYTAGIQQKPLVGFFFKEKLELLMTEAWVKITSKAPKKWRKWLPVPLPHEQVRSERRAAEEAASKQADIEEGKLTAMLSKNRAGRGGKGRNSDAILDFGLGLNSAESADFLGARKSSLGPLLVSGENSPADSASSAPPKGRRTPLITSLPLDISMVSHGSATTDCDRTLDGTDTTTTVTDHNKTGATVSSWGVGDGSKDTTLTLRRGASAKSIGNTAKPKGLDSTASYGSKASPNPRSQANLLRNAENSGSTFRIANPLSRTVRFQGFTKDSSDDDDVVSDIFQPVNKKSNDGVSQQPPLHAVSLARSQLISLKDLKLSHRTIDDATSLLLEPTPLKPINPQNALARLQQPPDFEFMTRRRIARYPLEQFLKDNGGWKAFFKGAMLKEMVYSSVIVVYRATPKNGREKSSAALKVREYTDVPVGDVEALIPEKDVLMPPMGTVAFATQIIVVVVFLVMGLAEFFEQATGEADSSAANETNKSRLMMALILVAGLGSRLFTLISNHTREKSAYEHEIEDWVEKKREGKDDAVVSKLASSVCSQECKEILLAYYCLWHFGPMTAIEVQRKIHAFLREEYKFQNFCFDIVDALTKLQSLGLITVRDDEAMSKSNAAGPTTSGANARTETDTASYTDGSSAYTFSSRASNRDTVFSIVHTPSEWSKLHPLEHLNTISLRADPVVEEVKKEVAAAAAAAANTSGAAVKKG